MTLVADPFGRDLSCTNAMQRGRMVSGVRLIAEAIFRRITTPRGELLYNPNYGDDVRELIQMDFDSENAARSFIQSRVEAQCDFEDRVTNVRVEVSFAQIDDERTAIIDIYCDSEIGPFDLSVSATELDVSLLKVPE